MAARTTKIRHDENTRAKIQVAAIINRFQDCVDGKVELTTQQVSCGKSLLDKRLPNLQATEMKHDVADGLADLMREVDGRGRGLPDRR